MKNISPKLIKLLKEGYCTPQISRIARKTNEPAMTIHYNIKKLEREKAIKSYKAVFDYEKIGEGFCAFMLVNLSPDEYGNPEKIAEALAKYPEIESIDICTGDWEMVLKIRAKNQEEYYSFIKNVFSRKGILKVKSLVSLNQLKNEFIER